MRKKLIRLGALLSVSIFVASCSSGPNEASDSTPVGTNEASNSTPVTAVFSNIAETATLDPAIVFSSDGFVFARNVYEGLVEYKPGTIDIGPLLAESWETSDDGLTFTFQLRSGVKFHDGSDLTAEGVVTSLERILDVNQGPASFMTNIASITADGSDKVAITLENVDYTFLGKLPKLPIVSAAAIEQNKTTADPLASEWFAINAAGTGPYKLDNWQRNQAINLVAFEDYWHEFEPGTPSAVTLRVDPEIATAMQLLEAGEIDFMGAVGPDDSARAMTMDGVQVLESPSYYGQVMPMNVTRGPLKDVNVRKAIALAFDYQAMVDFYQGFAEPSTGPLPTGFGASIANRPRFQQNIEEAKALLAKAGYAEGFEIEYIGLKGLSYFEFAGTLIEQNLKEIGITVKQTLIPWPEMAASYSKRDTAGDISFLNMSAFTNDAGAYLGQSYLSTNTGDKGGYNWSFYENKQLDAKINGLSQIADPAERLAATEKVNAEIADLHLAIYVTQPKLAQPVKAGWSGFYDSFDANYSVRFFYTRFNG